MEVHCTWIGMAHWMGIAIGQLMHMVISWHIGGSGILDGHGTFEANGTLDAHRSRH